MKVKTFAASVLAGMLVSVPVVAHHSFAAEFDASKQVTLIGVVTKVEWLNPHSFIYVDVKDEKTGKMENWTCELGSPNALSRIGWTRQTILPGMMVTIPGARAKDGSLRMNATNVTLPDGRSLNAASSSQLKSTGQ